VQKTPSLCEVLSGRRLAGRNSSLRELCDLVSGKEQSFFGAMCYEISLFKGSVAGLPLTCTEAEH
jgi:hypothetical protein